MLLSKILRASVQFLTFFSLCLDDHGSMWGGRASVSLGFWVTAMSRAHGGPITAAQLEGDTHLCVTCNPENWGCLLPQQALAHPDRQLSLKSFWAEGLPVGTWSQTSWVPSTRSRDWLSSLVVLVLLLPFSRLQNWETGNEWLIWGHLTC